MNPMTAKLLQDFANAVERRYALLVEKGQPQEAGTYRQALTDELDYRLDDDGDRDRESVFHPRPMRAMV